MIFVVVDVVIALLVTFRAWRSAGHLHSVCLAYWSWWMFYCSSYIFLFNSVRSAGSKAKFKNYSWRKSSLSPHFAKPLVCALLKYVNDGRRPPAFGDGHRKQTARWCWRGNELVLSDWVKLCEHDSRLVSVAKHNTDEPLVEASLVGNVLSKRTSYKGVLTSVAAVNRCWPHGNRSKGGWIATQALACNRGEPAAAREKQQGGITIKPIIPACLRAGM